MERDYMELLAKKEALQHENIKLKSILKAIYNQSDASHQLDDETYERLSELFERPPRSD